MGVAKDLGKIKLQRQSGSETVHEKDLSIPTSGGGRISHGKQ